MRKIISLFKRDYGGSRLVYDEAVPGAEWVMEGEGEATRKFDGTACMVRAGVLFKRYDVKKGKGAPPGFEAAQEPDDVTGHWPGWLPVGDGTDDRWHREGLEHYRKILGIPPDGTYELIGPKVQGNSEHQPAHVLVRHGDLILDGVPRDFEGIGAYFKLNEHIEGVVWHHSDGRMVKIKRKDFGLKWPMSRS